MRDPRACTRAGNARNETRFQTLLPSREHRFRVKRPQCTLPPPPTYMGKLSPFKSMGQNENGRPANISNVSPEKSTPFPGRKNTLPAAPASNLNYKSVPSQIPRSGEKRRILPFFTFPHLQRTLTRSSPASQGTTTPGRPRAPIPGLPRDPHSGRTLHTHFWDPRGPPHTLPASPGTPSPRGDCTPPGGVSPITHSPGGPVHPLLSPPPVLKPIKCNFKKYVPLVIQLTSIQNGLRF